MTIVASHRADPRSEYFTPFSGTIEGQYHTVTETPDLTVLYGLSLFLARNVPATHRHRVAIVRVYLAFTEAGQLLADAEAGRPVAGTVFAGKNAVPRAITRASALVRAYELDQHQAHNPDWDFSVLPLEWDIAEFFAREASLMIRAGATRVAVVSSCNPPTSYSVGSDS